MSIVVFVTPCLASAHLHTNLHLHLQGCVDLRMAASTLLPSALSGGGGGLKALAARLLGRQLDKSQQRSDWGAAELSTAQVGC